MVALLIAFWMLCVLLLNADPFVTLALLALVWVLWKSFGRKTRTRLDDDPADRTVKQQRERWTGDGHG